MAECICRYAPACEPHDHRTPNHGEGLGCYVHGHPIKELPINDNPRCPIEGGPTQRAGSCFVCVICGFSSSC